MYIHTYTYIYSNPKNICSWGIVRLQTTYWLRCTFTSVSATEMSFAMAKPQAWASWAMGIFHEFYVAISPPASHDL